jgi:hypothetical protein
MIPEQDYLVFLDNRPEAEDINGNPIILAIAADRIDSSFEHLGLNLEEWWDLLDIYDDVHLILIHSDSAEDLVAKSLGYLERNGNFSLDIRVLL